MKAASWVITVGLGAVLLYISLRGIDWTEVRRLIGSAKPDYIGFGCVLASIGYFLRAIRWRVLLRSEGEVSVSLAFWATAAGYFGNNFLPARAGELIRTMMISSKCGFSKTFVLTTALVERVADAIALVLISALVLLTLPPQAGWLVAAVRPMAALALAVALTIALVPLFEHVWHSLLKSLPLHHSIANRLSHIIGQMMVGLRSFHHPRRLLAFLGLTLIIWGIEACAVTLGGIALGIEIPISGAVLLISGLGLGSALPSTPGYVGIYQFVAVTVLAPFGISRTEAIAYIVFAQVLSYLLMAFWAGIGFWLHGSAVTASRAAGPG